MIKLNTKAIQFSGINQENKEVSLNDYKGKYVVLYFYPKDDTPGCTTEACSLRDNFEVLQKYAYIIGISADSVESHKKFIEKYHLPFTLISDPDKKIIRDYEADGILTKRISYLIDPNSNVIKVYPKVNPSQHAQEIINDLKQISK